MQIETDIISCGLLRVDVYNNIDVIIPNPLKITLSDPPGDEALMSPQRKEYIMKKMGMGFWLGMVILAALTACCAYLAFWGMQAGDRSGPWLFVAFAFLFGIPLLFGIVRIASTKIPTMKGVYDKASGADQPQTTRFVPHWFMMTAIIVMGLLLLYGLITGILLLLRR